MKIPLFFDCARCQGRARVFVNLNATQADWRCGCGWVLPGVHMFNANPGLLILRRARYELRVNDDASLCIVFAAMAVDSETSRLFFKWSRLGRKGSTQRLPKAHLEEMLRRHRTVPQKLEAVARLMHRSGLQDFIKSRSDLRRWIATGFRSLHVDRFAQSVAEQLFWPRNSIIHQGDTSHDARMATRAFNIARMTLCVFQELDAKKRLELRTG